MSTTTVPAVISCCYGGFGLSEEAEELLLQKRAESGVSVEEPWCYYDYGRHRTDPLLVAVVRELGSLRASSSCADLEIVNVPKEYEHCFTYTEYDGVENITCDPAKLIQHTLRQTNLESLSDLECRETLRKLMDLAATGPRITLRS